MKVLLIRPPETFSKRPGASIGYSYGIPLGIGYIAAVLKRAGYEVVIYDAITTTWQDVRQRIAKENPDVIGISNQFSSQFENAKIAAETAKAINKSFLIIAGGSHPSACPSDFFTKTDCVDIVVVGEGEETMLEVLERISKRLSWEDVKGIAFKRGNEVVINERRPPIMNLDGLPLPAYELFDMENYFKPSAYSSERPVFVYPGSERAINLVTSRGCPYNCIFCSIHSTMGHRWRSHSPEYVMSHVNLLIQNYNIRHLHFEDDNLTWDKRRFEKILDGLLNSDTKITWDTPNGVRGDVLDEQLLKKSKGSGCVYLIMGLESGDQHVLDVIIKKRISLKVIENIAMIARRTRLNIETFFVIGFPGETLRNMKNTLRFAFKLQFRYNIYPILFIATPLPGTRLHEICLEKGYVKKDFSYSEIPYSVLNKGMIETEDFNLSDINRLFKRFKRVRAALTVLNFCRVCFSSPIFVMKKSVYLFRIFFISSPKAAFNPKIILRNLMRYNFYAGPV